jgi:hypothetical protein
VALNPNVIPYITTTGISILSSSQIVAFTTSQILQLTTTQIPVIIPDIFINLLTSQIVALNPNVIPYITTTGISILSSSQILSFTTSQIFYLTSSQVPVIIPYVFGSLTTLQISAINPNAIYNLQTADINVLSTGQIVSLTTGQFIALQTNQVNIFNTTQIISLTTLQINILEPTELSLLQTNQIITITGIQILALSTQQIGSLSTIQLAILNSTQSTILLNNLQIISDINLTNPILVDPANNLYYNNDYILNINLSYVNNNYINWTNFTPLQQTNQITCIKISKYNNNNIYLTSKNTNGTNQIIITQYDETLKQTGIVSWDISHNSNNLNNFAISSEYVPMTFVTTSLEDNSITIYIKQNISKTAHDIMTMLWNQTSINLQDSDNKSNKKFYSQISYNGNIILITYYFENSLINNNTNGSKYFILVTNQSNQTNPLTINYNGYRQILLSKDGTKLYLLSYPIQQNKLYISTLYVANISDSINIKWSPLKDFILPNYGYCPLINISYDGKYITVYYNQMNGCSILMSSDYGNTWTEYNTNYNIYNQNTLDVTTMSSNGLYQTYLISNKNTFVYIGYFTGNKWRTIYADDTLQFMEKFQTYCISDDFSNIILYKPNYNQIINVSLSSFLTVNKLFDNLNYTYNLNIPTINPNISLNINRLDSAFDYVLLYATTSNNLINNKLESIGTKILRIIYANVPNVIYPISLLNSYSVLISNIVNNTISSSINNYIRAAQNQNQFMNAYIYTNQYYIDITSLNSNNIINSENIMINMNIDNLALEIPLQLTFYGITKNILLKINY